MLKNFLLGGKNWLLVASSDELKAVFNSGTEREGKKKKLYHLAPMFSIEIVMPKQTSANNFSGHKVFISGLITVVLYSCSQTSKCE